MNVKSWLKKDLIAFSLTSFFNDFCHEMTTSLLPLFITQLLGPARAPIALGVITGFADAAATIMKLISGILADKITLHKPFIVGGYFITSVFVSLIGTATHIGQVFVYQTAAWMGRGLREPMRDVWLTTISSPQNYGTVFGFERALDTLGAIAGPLLAYFTISLFSLRTNYLIAFIPGIISVLIVLLCTSNYKAEPQHRAAESFITHLTSLPSHFNYFVLVMFIFGIANFNKTLLIYRAQEQFTGAGSSSLLASSSAILLYVLFNVIRAVGEFTSGSLSDYLPRKILIACGFGLFSIVTLLLLLAHTALFVWVIIFMCAGLSAGIITAVEKSYAAELLPQQVRGTGFGLLQSIDGLGDLISSVIVGALWSYHSPNAAFIYSFLMSSAALFLILFVKKEHGFRSNKYKTI